jgi:hypothetical protein
VTLTIGSYVLEIPPGYFAQKGKKLHWELEGRIGGVKLHAQIKQSGKSEKDFDYDVDAKGTPNLIDRPRPIAVGLKIGNDAGNALVH